MEMAENFDRNRALAYLNLCDIAYGTNLEKMPSDIASAGGWEPGSWQCVWGPVLNPKHGNLAFVAKFFPEDPSHVPTYAITIRGTDISDRAKNWWEDLYQLEEDLSIGERKPLPRTQSPDILISNGAYLGWESIDTLTSDGKTIERFLLDDIASSPAVRPVVAVIGHSLGGCLSTVFALTLSILLTKMKIEADHIPCTFAAPTAGNQGFATLYANSFPTAGRYFNSLDVIPRGWADLPSILTMYQHPCPRLVELFVDVMMLEIERSPKQPYVQPNVLSTCLEGTDMASSWYSEAAAQHHVGTYMSLLKHADSSAE